MGLLTRDEHQSLSDLLLQMPTIFDAEARRLLVIDLPYNLQASIPQSEVPAQHVAALVATVESPAWAPLPDGSWPVVAVIENALYTVEGSQVGTALHGLLDLAKSRATTPAAAAPNAGPTEPAPALVLVAPADLTGAQLQAWSQALLQAFPTRGALAQMVEQGLHFQLDDISKSNSVPGIILDLLEWATAQGRTGDLLTATAAASPALAALLTPGGLAAESGGAAPQPGAVPPNLAALAGGGQLGLAGAGDRRGASLPGGGRPVGRRLREAERRQLQAALSRAFPRKAQLAQLVWDTFDASVIALAGDTSLPIMVSNLITWAEETGYLPALVQAAVAATPDAPGLRALGTSDLNAAQLQQIQNALLATFPDPGALAAVVQAGLDVQLAVVAGAGPLAAVVYNLTMWAESQHTIPELLAAALAARPDSSDLRAVIAQLGLDPAWMQDLAQRRPPGSALPAEVQAQLVALLAGLPAFATGDATERTRFLARAGLPPAWIASRDWSAPATEAATQLVTATVAQPSALTPGYTLLGLVLERVLRESGVGRAAALFIAQTVLQYHLVDLSRAVPSDVLQDLLRAM